MRKVIGHTAVSATQSSSVALSIWQNGAKENYSRFEISKMVVKAKTSIIQLGPYTYIKGWLENESDESIVQNRVKEGFWRRTFTTEFC